MALIKQIEDAFQCKAFEELLSESPDLDRLMGHIKNFRFIADKFAKSRSLYHFFEIVNTKYREYLFHETMDKVNSEIGKIFIAIIKANSIQNTLNPNSESLAQIHTFLEKNEDFAKLLLESMDEEELDFKLCIMLDKFAKRKRDRAKLDCIARNILTQNNQSTNVFSFKDADKELQDRIIEVTKEQHLESKLFSFLK